jgi:hypothetical protein
VVLVPMCELNMVYFGMKGDRTRNWVVEGTDNILLSKRKFIDRPLTWVQPKEMERKERRHCCLIIVAW